MKSKFGREIALLTAPILVIGAVAFWNGKIGSWSGFGVPLGLYQGKPRLEITDWKSEPPSALDFARGISSRWTVTTWQGGVCSVDGKPPRSGQMTNPTHLYFAWKRAGKWQHTPFKYEESELDVVTDLVREKPISHEVHLGLPLDLVPRDAEEVRLRGHLDGWMVCQSRSVPVSVQSAPLDVSILKPRQMRPTFTGSRVSPLKLVRVKQSYSLQTYGATKTPSWQINSSFSYAGKSKKDTVQVARTWIEDARGRWISSTSSLYWGPYPGLGKFKSGDLSNPTWGIGIMKPNPKRGPFTFKSWVYVDKNEWPVEVSIPLKLK